MLKTSTHPCHTTKPQHTSFASSWPVSLIIRLITLTTLQFICLSVDLFIKTEHETEFICTNCRLRWQKDLLKHEILISFCSTWKNVSTTMKWTAVKSDVHGCQRMNPTDFSDQTFTRSRGLLYHLSWLQWRWTAKVNIFRHILYCSTVWRCLYFYYSHVIFLYSFILLQKKNNLSGNLSSFIMERKLNTLHHCSDLCSGFFCVIEYSLNDWCLSINVR